VAYGRPEPLGKQHRLDDFRCGEAALDDWLKRHARAAHASDSARVFVATLEDRETVVGYCALAAAQVAPEDATPRSLKGQPLARPVPAILLARLAVDERHQSAGVGRSSFSGRGLPLRRGSGGDCARVLVHAKQCSAKRWYIQFDFEGLRRPASALDAAEGRPGVH
jgi:hypothetical protein